MRTECEDDKGWQFRSEVPGRRVRERGTEGGARPVRPRWAEGGRGPGQADGGGEKWRNVRPRAAGNERWAGCGARNRRVNGAARRFPSARQRVPNSAKPVNCVVRANSARTSTRTRYGSSRRAGMGGGGWYAAPPARTVSGPARWTARAPGRSRPLRGGRAHRRAMRWPLAAGPGTGRRAERRGRKGRRGWWGTAWRLIEWAGCWGARWRCWGWDEEWGRPGKGWGSAVRGAGSRRARGAAAGGRPARGRGSPRRRRSRWPLPPVAGRDAVAVGP